MKVAHSTIVPILNTSVIALHNLFEVEGVLTYSKTLDKYYIDVGDSMIFFKIGNVKKVVINGKDRDIYLHGAEQIGEE
jgi:hypothetical protein